MKIDLHNHSIYSDGVLSPKELIERAIKNNVDIFALTDHDSVFGCDEIYDLANTQYKDKIRVIKGMELSTEYNGESVHIVCLFKNNSIPKEIYEFSKNHKEYRTKRAIDMLNNINKYYGLKVDIDELIKESKVITRANMMRHIAKLNNLTFDEAKVYCSSSSKAYIPSTKLSVPDGLKLIHDNNGIAIFAHPCLIKERKTVLEILKLGKFDGIEVRYPSIKNDEEFFSMVAEEYGLLKSAGSDCHGDSTHADIGTKTLKKEEFLPIANLIGFNI